LEQKEQDGEREKGQVHHNEIEKERKMKNTAKHMEEEGKWG
jgi:hypothetical protein